MSSSSDLKMRTLCAQNVMQSIFWGLAVEISRPIISSLENVKISLPGTVLPFSVVCMLFFLRKKCGIAQWGPFSIFTAKKKDSTPKGIRLHVTTN